MTRTFRDVYDPTVEDNLYFSLIVDGVLSHIHVVGTHTSHFLIYSSPFHPSISPFSYSSSLSLFSHFISAFTTSRLSIMSQTPRGRVSTFRFDPAKEAGAAAADELPVFYLEKNVNPVPSFQDIRRSIKEAPPPSTSVLSSSSSSSFYPHNSQEADSEGEDLLLESVTAWHDEVVTYTMLHRSSSLPHTSLQMERYQLQHLFLCLRMRTQADSLSALRKRDELVTHLSTSIISPSMMFEIASQMDEDDDVDVTSLDLVFCVPSLRYLCVASILKEMPRHRVAFILDNPSPTPSPSPSPTPSPSPSPTPSPSPAPPGLKPDRHRGEHLSLRSAFLYSFGQSIQYVFSQLGLSFSLPKSSSPSPSPSPSPSSFPMLQGEGDDVIYVPIDGEREKERSQVVEWASGETVAPVFKIVILGTGGVGTH